MKLPENLLRDSFVILVLITIGILSRFAFIDLPNFKPIAAIVLFAAFWFRSYWVAAMSLVLIMLVSNAGLDHCPWQVTCGVVAGLAFAALLGRRLRGRITSANDLAANPVQSASQLFGSAVAMSAAFWLISNFAVWSMGQWYPLTLEGLISCYAAAVPFFKYTFFGDVMFTAGIFSLWYAVSCCVGTARQRIAME